MNKISKLNTLKNFSYSLDDSLWSRNDSFFQIFSIRHGNIDCCNSFNWSIQVEKGVSLMNACSNLSTDSTSGETILDCDQSVSFFNTLDDSFSVQWFDSSEINDFTADSFFSELLCSL